MRLYRPRLEAMVDKMEVARKKKRKKGKGRREAVLVG